MNRSASGGAVCSGYSEGCVCVQDHFGRKWLLL